MSAPRITAIDAREVLECRGLPTVQVDIALDDGTLATADVPSGRSTGAYEVAELRDGGERFGGFGVRDAVANSPVRSPRPWSARSCRRSASSTAG